jgi:hypothetical protein
MLRLDNSYCTSNGLHCVEKRIRSESSVALAAPPLAASALYGGHKENSIRKIKSIKEKAQKFSPD